MTHVTVLAKQQCLQRDLNPLGFICADICWRKPPTLEVHGHDHLAVVEFADDAEQFRTELNRRHVGRCEFVL
jgi:hypothetical protein